MSTTTINLNSLSNEDLQKLMASLPKESELGAKIKEVLSNSKTAEALKYTKDALVSNSGSIVKAADETGGKLITTATKVAEVYGDVPFKFVNGILGSVDAQLEVRLMKKRIQAELASRSAL